jgi:ankyrin repeat protein
MDGNEYGNEMSPILLHSMIAEFHLDQIDFSIFDKADLNWKDKDGFSALMYAIYRRAFDLVLLLLENGADLNDYNRVSTQK